MLWIKAFHLIFIITWFAGLFYLPRLFVYHAMSVDNISVERFKIMEKKLYYGIMLPSLVLSLLFGFWLLWLYGFEYFKNAHWLHLKLLLVLFLLIFHFYCGFLQRQFYLDKNKHTHVFYRWINEIPVVLLIGIIILVVVKPI